MEINTETTTIDKVKNTITITLTREQAEYLAVMAEQGIDDKEEFMNGPYSDYAPKERDDIVKRMNLASSACQIIYDKIYYTK
jgi:hypothetical protein